tara:strand:- start:298 stop:693 length:396 start_codon:yes stop_codon:yes gene_type:complete
MPDNNPKNSVGGGWHLTHSIIQQIYSYSANSGKTFDVGKNPNILCVDNHLVFQSTNKKSGDVDTGILFDNMMEFLMAKPRNRNDNSYNTKIQKGQNIDATSNLQVSMKDVDSKGKKQRFKKKNKFEKSNDF